MEHIFEMMKSVMDGVNISPMPVWIKVIIALFCIFSIFYYYIRLLSDKTNYDKIREIIKEEIKK